MFDISKIKNSILQGDTIEILKNTPSNSVDVIFADPPYFMQTDGVLLRTEGTKFEGVEDEWDKFDDYKQYDFFCNEWLKECKRVLKKDGTIWVIGAFQNIYRIGYLMQNLGFWILNDVIWNKNNPAPNFKGTRFTNANETMLWCSKSENSKYTFNYKTMKYLNGGTQMRSVWNISLCTGNERLKDENGKKIHSTQKPEKLLENVILSSTKVGDIILDPFMGTGTTAAVAKKTGRNFIGIEREEKYIKAANSRIKNIKFDSSNPIYSNELDIKPPRIGVEKLIDKKYIIAGEDFFNLNETLKCSISQEGKLTDEKGKVLSIHKMAAHFLKKENHNGWDFWYVKRKNKLVLIDDIRSEYLKTVLGYQPFEI